MEAFTYCWTDYLTNKLYIGVHKGKYNDGYICSSKIFLEQYNKRPADFTRQIIANGSYDIMLVFESKILKSVNAKNNIYFYNMHNGDGKFINKGHTYLTRKKLSLQRKGINNPNFGKTLSIDAKQRISNKLKGRKSSRKGQITSAETKQKISISKTGANNAFFNKHHSIETKSKLSLSIKGRYCYNNGQKTKMFFDNSVPIGWVKGRV